MYEARAWCGRNVWEREVRSKLADLLLDAANKAFSRFSLSAGVGGARIDEGSDVLWDGFSNPPPESRPRVWWHWMNGNVTEEGIADDLDWMKHIGIGGLTNFDVARNTPQIVDERLVYMSPDWKQAFRHAAQKAQENGLELTIASSPGWSETGGPWVQPEDAMKKLVWSTTDVEGGRPFAGVLPAPPTITGPFQDAPIGADRSATRTDVSMPQQYNDSLVIAFPLDEIGLITPVSVSVEGKFSLDLNGLIDGSFSSGQAMQGANREATYLQVDFGQVQDVRSISLALIDALGLSASSPYTASLAIPDGLGDFHTLRELPIDRTTQATVSFPPVQVESLRILFRLKPPYDVSRLGGTPGAMQGPP